MTDSRVAGQVRIVGAGLLGASIGHGLRAAGVDVILDDASRSNLRLAIDYGAGRAAAPDDAPSLIVVAVPPDAVAEVVAKELATHPTALVTDVASVKSGIRAELTESGADVDRYVGSHPMAGRERGGAISARADLFDGRPWVICGGNAAQRRVLEDLALELGAVPVLMTPEEHDASVALISHVPQVVSSLLAARLIGAAEPAVSLAGQGLRDTTRIAGSDPELWVQILSANAGAVVEILRAYRDDLDALVTVLDQPDAPGARRGIAEALAAGNTGLARIPGKHGTSKKFSRIVVKVEDRPGELGRLLAEMGDLGVNMEDLRLEHSPRAQVGFAEIAVLPEVERKLVTDLQERGWTIMGALE